MLKTGYFTCFITVRVSEQNFSHLPQQSVLAPGACPIGMASIDLTKSPISVGSSEAVMHSAGERAGARACESVGERGGSSIRQMRARWKRMDKMSTGSYTIRRVENISWQHSASFSSVLTTHYKKNYHLKIKINENPQNPDKKKLKEHQDEFRLSSAPLSVLDRLQSHLLPPFPALLGYDGQKFFDLRRET